MSWASSSIASFELAPVWIDSHCHLQDLEDLEAALLRAERDGVVAEICIGTGAESSRRALELARALGSDGRKVWATIGLHPHDSNQGCNGVEALLAEHQASLGEQSDTLHAPGDLVAIGECGLDYFYEHSPRDQQREAFVAQIALAKLHNLALIVHTRDAWDDTFGILSREGPPEHLVIHCFTGGPTEARRCLDLGAYLSFSGIITFKSAGEIREAAKLCPSDRILVETDAPFLAPVPHRGKPNEPGFVAIVGNTVAELRGVTAQGFAAEAFANTATLFALKV
jgi:TatD DNase family protein